MRASVQRRVDQAASPRRGGLATSWDEEVMADYAHELDVVVFDGGRRARHWSRSRIYSTNSFRTSRRILQNPPFSTAQEQARWICARGVVRCRIKQIGGGTQAVDPTCVFAPSAPLGAATYGPQPNSSSSTEFRAPLGARPPMATDGPVLRQPLIGSYRTVIQVLTIGSRSSGATNYRASSRSCSSLSAAWISNARGCSLQPGPSSRVMRSVRWATVLGWMSSRFAAAVRPRP